MSSSDVLAPRIPADSKLFRDEYMRTCKPCVVTGLFEGAPLDAIRSMDDVRHEIGSGTVCLRSNYMNAMTRQLDAFANGSISIAQLFADVTAEKRITLADYLDVMAKNRGSDPYADYANEQKPPPEVMDRIGDLKFFKDLGFPKSIAWENDAGMDFSLEPEVNKVVLFMSNLGNCADTHTDWDGRHVLNHQMVGVKRFVLFPPEAAVKLNAVESYPAPRLRRMSDGERHELLRYTGGVECVIGPGEACYMPPFFYHHIDYLSDAIGVAVRFGGAPRRIIPAMVSETHRDGFMQCFWATVLKDPDSPRHIEGVARLQRALDAEYANRITKYRAIVELVRGICDEWKVFGEEPVHMPWLTPAETLQRPLSTVYLDPPPTWSDQKKRWWRTRETARLAAATLASRVVAAIEGAPPQKPKHVEPLGFDMTGGYGAKDTQTSHATLTATN